ARHQGPAPGDRALPGLQRSERRRPRARGRLRVAWPGVREPLGRRQGRHGRPLERPLVLRIAEVAVSMRRNGTTFSARNRVAANGAAAPASVRCAIYGRKSVEERIATNFGSIEAQREACEAYVKSQASLAWTALPQRYDDE